MRPHALYGEEQVTVLQQATVAGDSAKRRRWRLREALQQVSKCRRWGHVFGRHAHFFSDGVAIACMTLPGSRAGRASGGMASSRSDSDMTSANTGAATSLP